MTDAPDRFAQLLAESPFMAELDDESRDALIPLFQPRTFEAGERLITAGADDRHMLLLLEGEVDVFVREEGQHYLVATLKPGATFGEISFFDPLARRTADVVAKGPGMMGVLQPEDYVDLRLRAHPAASSLEQVVVHTLCERLENADGLLAGLLDEHRSGGLLRALNGIFGRAS